MIAPAPYVPARIFFILLIGAVTALACGTGSDDRPTSDTDTASEEAALLPVIQDGKWGYMDTTGAVAVEPRFNRAFHFSEGLALVESDSGFGFIRDDGSYAITPRFEDAWHFTEGNALVQANGKWQLVDSQGDVVDAQDAATDPNFTLRAGALIEDDYQPRQFQLIHTAGRYGFRNDEGEIIIDPRYQNAWYFSDGLARVMIDSLWGFIDRNGEIVIEPRYDLAWDFQNGLALVMVDGKYGYIDRQGSFVWRPSE